MEMSARPGPAKSVDEYIAGAPRAARGHLRQLRKAIRAAAPVAAEGISYGMPTFKHEGMLVGFAAFKEHYSLFVMSPAAIEANSKALARYYTSKGTVRVPYGRQLPDGLVRKLVRARVRENEARARERAERRARRRRTKSSR